MKSTEEARRQAVKIMCATFSLSNVRPGVRETKGKTKRCRILSTYCRATFRLVGNIPSANARSSLKRMYYILRMGCSCENPKDWRISGTIHLQVSMPSPGLELRSYGTTVRIANNYIADRQHRK
ncbi:hypothetical protein TNCV_1451181 [Trichonephila clavipes]|nr:hypothetical protein TNCV_1451181 [Trichonephila clavipes]